MRRHGNAARPRLVLIAESYRRLTGRPLVAAAGNLGELWTAPRVVVAHGTEADPVFFYGNRLALELFELDFAAFTRLPSRFPPNRWPWRKGAAPSPGWPATAISMTTPGARVQPRPAFSHHPGDGVELVDAAGVLARPGGDLSTAGCALTKIPPPEKRVTAGPVARHRPYSNRFRCPARRPDWGTMAQSAFFRDAMAESPTSRFSDPAAALLALAAALAKELRPPPCPGTIASTIPWSGTSASTAWASVELVQRIEAAFGVGLGGGAFAEAETPADLLRLLDRAGPPRLGAGPRPPTPRWPPANPRRPASRPWSRPSTGMPRPTASDSRCCSMPTTRRPAA